MGLSVIVRRFLRRGAVLLCAAHMAVSAFAEGSEPAEASGGGAENAEVADVSENSGTVSESVSDSITEVEKPVIRFVLSTGETLIGEVISRDDVSVEIKNSYTIIKFPSRLVLNETLEQVVPEPAAAPIAEKIMAEKSDDEWRPFFGSEKSVVGRNDPLYTYLRGTRKAYRDFMDSIVPEGFSAKFSIGYSNEVTTLAKDKLYLYLTAMHEWDDMSFSLTGFYNYEWQKTFAGVETTTTDKYGLSGDYRWSFWGRESDWFLSVVSSYRHDSIKQIYHQYDEFVALGYDFKFPRWGFKWSVAVGPGARYIEAAGFDRHLVPMGYVNESLTWDLTELLRFEHTGLFGLDVETSDYGTAYVMAGLVFAPEGIVSIALRYTIDYDGVNSQITDERKLILSLEIPITNSVKK